MNQRRIRKPFVQGRRECPKEEKVVSHLGTPLEKDARVMQGCLGELTDPKSGRMQIDRNS